MYGKITQFAFCSKDSNTDSFHYSHSYYLYMTFQNENQYFNSFFLTALTVAKLIVDLLYQFNNECFGIMKVK